jgi:hypothetical protein
MSVGVLGCPAKVQISTRAPDIHNDNESTAESITGEEG